MRILQRLGAFELDPDFEPLTVQQAVAGYALAFAAYLIGWAVLDAFPVAAL